MTLNAFKNDVTVLDEAVMNSLLALQDFSLVYTGTAIDSKIGAGVAEFDCAGCDHAIRFTATGVTEIIRAEFEIIKNGVGADLICELRSGFNSDGSTEGTLLKKMVVPKEFIPAAKAYWSVPLALAGLTAGNQYWFIVRKAGDAINHFHLHGEASQDASFPCYKRAGTAGAWTLENSIHFKAYSGDTGDLLHGIYGTYGVTWIEYTGETVSKVYRYLPSKNQDGSIDWSNGIRNIQTYTWSGEYLKNGVVA